MGISFHCEHCGKKIEAPDTAGGKWGKCPACHNKVYVPANNPPDDMLQLAPIDTEEERRRKKMVAEVDRLREKILNEKDVPEEASSPKTSPLPQNPATSATPNLLSSLSVTCVKWPTASLTSPNKPPKPSCQTAKTPSVLSKKSPLAKYLHPKSPTSRSRSSQVS